MNEFQTVLSAAAKLSVDERLRLIDALSSSVPDDQPPALSDEWLSKIARRSAEIDAGAVQTESWTSVRDKLRRRVGFPATQPSHPYSY
ncbi:MAG: addiction module protein [Aureliella sp.]